MFEASISRIELEGWRDFGGRREKQRKGFVRSCLDFCCIIFGGFGGTRMLGSNVQVLMAWIFGVLRLDVSPFSEAA